MQNTANYPDLPDAKEIRKKQESYENKVSNFEKWYLVFNKKLNEYEQHYHETKYNHEFEFTITKYAKEPVNKLDKGDYVNEYINMIYLPEYETYIEEVIKRVKASNFKVIECLDEEDGRWKRIWIMLPTKRKREENDFSSNKRQKIDSDEESNESVSSNS